ncbi:MAG: hypothetical protein HFI13_10785 [Lachnospiraceae bacterium]|nr:hypothetical protein [Lachnospiraceae bacterium]
MKKIMKQNVLFALGLMTALSLSGCQSKQTDTESEALRQQITQLEQQIQNLEQQISSDSESTPENNTAPTQAPAEDNAAPEAPASNETPADTPSPSTTDTLEELTAQVAAYEEKVSSAASSGSPSEDMDQFFTLKQEEKKIDDDLDRYEDELEYLYRKGSLTRDDYRSLERELERLEDRLDAAEDTLEYIYGIDD